MKKGCAKTFNIFYQMNCKIEGTPNSPVLVFSNSLGSDIGMWDEVVPLLLPYFRVLRYNTRGHGANSDSGYADFDIAQLGRDVMDLLDDNGIESAHFCGLSMGGLIGQWLGINHSARLKNLVIANTAAKIGTADTWNTRIETISQNGLEAIVDATMERWFTENFRKNNPQCAAEMRAMFLRSNAKGYARCCAAIRDADFRADLSRIAVKTLVIAGDQDPVTNVEQAEFLANNIPGARLNILPARHLSGAELPERFAETLLDFLVGKNTFERGMHIRRTVLGDAHVDKAIANINELNVDFQEFITKYAWGEIWSRPGLGKRERSFATLAMLIALNRKAEFQMHIRAALNNGVSPEEIREVILQSAIYCGLPAANEALHTAAEILST